MQGIFRKKASIMPTILIPTKFVKRYMDNKPKEYMYFYNTLLDIP